MLGRYEKKFYFDIQKYERTLSKIKFNSEGFTEVYPERIINSIYFDDYNFSSFKESKEGDLNRKKIRLRWYGNDCEKVSVNLEFKEKKAEIGIKKIFSLGIVNIKDILEKNFLQKLVEKSEFKNNFHKLSLINLVPVIFCFYKRKYFLSSNKLIRLTIDREISYAPISYRFNFWKKKLVQYPKFVIEIKYEKTKDIKEIFNNEFLETRTSRFSKYTNGVDFIYL